MAHRRNGNGKHGHRRNGGGRPKIDWQAARSWFARHPDASYVDVAEKFGVSDTAVRNHAREEDWEGYRRDVLDAAAARRRTADIRAVEERYDDTIRLIDELRDVLFDKVDVLDPVAVLRTFPRLLHHERLIAGDATDRLSIGEWKRAESAYQEVLRWAVAEAQAGRAPSQDAVVERLRVVLTETFEAAEA